MATNAPQKEPVLQVIVLSPWCSVLGNSSVLTNCRKSASGRRYLGDQPGVSHGETVPTHRRKRDQRAQLGVRQSSCKRMCGSPWLVRDVDVLRSIKG